MEQTMILILVIFAYWLGYKQSKDVFDLRLKYKEEEIKDLKFWIKFYKKQNKIEDVEKR